MDVNSEMRLQKDSVPPWICLVHPRLLSHFLAQMEATCHMLTALWRDSNGRELMETFGQRLMRNWNPWSTKDLWGTACCRKQVSELGSNPSSDERCARRFFDCLIVRDPEKEDPVKLMHKNCKKINMCGFKPLNFSIICYLGIHI